MATPFIDSLPLELVTHVTSCCGARGEAWLSELETKIAELERIWGIRIEAPFPAIEYNFVAPAKANDGAELVLKVAPPWEPVEIYGEAEYLRHRSGPHCVKLIAEHLPLRAILIERIHPGDNLFERFAQEPLNMLEPAIDALRRVTIAVPANIGPVQRLDDWFNNFRRYTATDFPNEYARKALGIYDRLGCAEPVYLHGDYHPGNVVGQGVSEYTVIDPKGLVGPIGYDIAVFLLNFYRMQESLLDVKDRLSQAIWQFSSAFGVSEHELREWAYAHTVIGSWWNYEDMPDLYDGSVVKADIWEV